MSIWSKLLGFKKTEDKKNIIGSKTTSVPCSACDYAVVDVEVGNIDAFFINSGECRKPTP